MKENKEKINIKNLNNCIKEYKKLGHYLNILSIIAIFTLVIYILNKLHIFHFIKDFLTVIMPLFIGIIIAWLLSPSIDKLEKKKVPRILSCIIIYTVIIGIMILILSLVIPNFIIQIKDLITATPDILKQVKNIIEDLFQNIDHASIDNIRKNIEGIIGRIGNQFSTEIPQTLIGGTKSFVSVMASFILSLMISFYLSFDYHKITKKIYNFIPNKYHENIKDLASRINSSLRSYLQGVFIVMLLVFISQAIGLSLVGLKAPLIFALFCAITDIIPYFGPWIGAIPAIIVGFTISPLTGILTIVSIIVVQTLENNFYQPLIMGHTMQLHPVVIILGLLIFGHFFGIIGMIIATPLVAIIKVIFSFSNEKLHLLERIEELRNY